MRSMELTALLLSRIQFALTIGFHILFPTLTIGLALLLFAHEAFWRRVEQSTSSPAGSGREFSR